jgi:hypothetical protein
LILTNTADAKPNRLDSIVSLRNVSDIKANDLGQVLTTLRGPCVVDIATLANLTALTGDYADVGLHVIILVVA